MPEGAYYQPRSPSKTALTVVVLLHGAAIAALALHKMDVVSIIQPPIKVIDINDPLPPPEVPPEPVKQPPQQPSSIDLVRTIVPTPPRPTEIRLEPMPVLPVVPSNVGPTIIDNPPAPPPPPPPPPPKAKEVEPARAKANLASYISDNDYPASAARNEEEGTTRFRLTVGADGRVAQCSVTGSSGSSALDGATCRIMKSRARFTPARDSSGNPTGDTVNSAIRWVLPAD
jgi:protein TonB